MRIAIIGGGIFGCSIAFALSELSNAKVTIIEKESDLLNAASKVNHNRLHLGYHYLRSIETAQQSIEGLLSFLFNFGDAVLNQFENYYAIAKEGSLTSTSEFIDFCNLVGIGYDERYPNKKFLNPDMVDSCFKVPEPIFDHGILKK
jgi:glycerol-3-phosphate dehydrogenase